MSQYADDTILLLDGSTASLRGALQELIKFSELSGLKVNLDKTSCLPIGTLEAGQVSSELNVKIVKELKILGTYCFDAATATGAPLVANRRTISYGRPPAVAHGPSVTLF